MNTYKKNPKAPAQLLCKKSGYPFYNTCEFDLTNLLTEAPAIVENLTFYIDSFSPNVQFIFEELEFKEEIKNLDKHNRLLGVVKKFSELDLDPDKVDNVKMSYMFEEIIRRFSENADAGDHYTPREVIRMLTSILLAEGCNDVFSEGREITVLEEERQTDAKTAALSDNIKETERKIEKIVDDICEGLSSPALRARLETLEADLAIMKADLEKLNTGPILSADVIRQGLQLALLKDHVSDAQVIRIFVHQVVLHDDRLLIEFNFKGGGEALEKHELLEFDQSALCSTTQTSGRTLTLYRGRVLALIDM